MLLIISEADGGSNERRLLNDLLQFYNSLERLVNEKFKKIKN